MHKYIQYNDSENNNLILCSNVWCDDSSSKTNSRLADIYLKQNGTTL